MRLPGRRPVPGAPTTVSLGLSPRLELARRGLSPPAWQSSPRRDWSSPHLNWRGRVCPVDSQTLVMLAPSRATACGALSAARHVLRSAQAALTHARCSAGDPCRSGTLAESSTGLSANALYVAARTRSSCARSSPAYQETGELQRCSPRP
jgi:hypothetical protein